MTFDNRLRWNEKHTSYPKEREPSNYAKDKERLFPRNSVICDLGGGRGIDSVYFIEKGHKVYLFDISDIGIKRAEDRAKNAGLSDQLVLKQVDLSKDKIFTKDNFFNIVYSRLSLQYFYPEQTTEILKEIYRVLKKGGTAYIAVKSPEDKREMGWLEKNTNKLGDGIYSEGGLTKTRFSKEQYRNFLKNAGISNFSVGDYVEHFGSQKVFVKSKADELLYIEIIIHK